MVEKKHYYGHRNRLRNRFLQIGIDSLQEYEIIELLLTYVIPQKDVKEIAKELLSKFKSIKGIFEAEEEDLKSIPYIKDKFITLIKLIKEINAIYRKQKALEKPIHNSIEEIAQYCIEKFGYNKEEEFHVLYIDNKFQILQEKSFPTKEFFFKGTIDKTVIYPRSIVEEGLKRKAYGLLIIHNHPNGNVQPSDYDINLTKFLDISAKSVGLTLIDHLIVTSNEYFSFKKQKLL